MFFTSENLERQPAIDIYCAFLIPEREQMPVFPKKNRPAGFPAGRNTQFSFLLRQSYNN
jgi:hypothetical protein